MDSDQLDDSQIFSPKVLETCLNGVVAVDGYCLNVRRSVAAHYSTGDMFPTYENQGHEWATLTFRLFPRQGFEFSRIMTSECFPEELQPYVRNMNIVQIGPSFCAEICIESELTVLTNIIRELYAANFHRVFYDEIKKVFAE